MNKDCYNSEIFYSIQKNTKIKKIFQKLENEKQNYLDLMRNSYLMRFFMNII